MHQKRHRMTLTDLLRRARFSPLQLLVIALATLAPLTVAATAAAAMAGFIATETMIEVALAAAENPGMVTFGAMLLASPVQWLTGRSQVRVRKYLGISFFLLAATNGAMFALEQGVVAAVGAPFLIAGTIALIVASPLSLTSSRWTQRALGMSRWRRLHKLTYVVAAALLAHVILLGDIGPGAVLIAIGLIARIPAVRRRIEGRRGDQSRSSLQLRSTNPTAQPSRKAEASAALVAGSSIHGA